MSPEEAKVKGRRIALISTAVVVSVVLIIFMFRETRGDFSNGILFFFEAILNPKVIILMSVLFGLTYLFGGNAGKGIILEEKSAFTSAIKYSSVIAIAIFIYIAVVRFVDGNSHPEDDFQLQPTTYILELLIRIGLFVYLPLLLIWFWVTNQIKVLLKK